MKVGYCPSHNVDGKLASAASTLMTVMGAEDARTIIIVDVHSPVNDLSPLIEYLSLKEQADALAVFMYEEGFDVTAFTDLSPVQKLFCEGVEDQLSRNVVYVGTFASPTSILWMTVPPPGEERWPVPLTLEEFNKNVETLHQRVIEESSADDIPLEISP